MVCFYGFQCNSSAVCESLKGFFCDLQTAWRLVLSMKPWSYIRLEFGLFSTIIAIIRACACWALFLVTLTNTVHLIYIYIYCVCVFLNFNYSKSVDTGLQLGMSHIILYWFLTTCVTGIIPITYVNFVSNNAQGHMWSHKAREKAQKFNSVSVQLYM